MWSFSRVGNWLQFHMRDGAGCYLLAVLLLLPVFARPEWLQKSVVQNTFFVIDISESMNVRDSHYPRSKSARLTLAKDIVREGMAALPCGSRVSVGLFAGDETVMLFEPLEVCRHFPEMEQVISRLDHRMRWIGDSWVVAGLVSAIKLAEAHKLNLVMVSDFDEMPYRSEPRLIDLLMFKGKHRGLLIGVGGAVAQPVPRLNDRQEIIGYWTREDAVINGNYPNLQAYVKQEGDFKSFDHLNGNPLGEVREHVSAFRQEIMQRIANTLQFEAVHANVPQDALNLLTRPFFRDYGQTQGDARWVFGLIAALVVVLGWFWPWLAKLMQTRK